MQINFIAFLISIAGLALIYYVCRHIFGMPQRISGVITIALTMLTYLYLVDNPNVIYDTQVRIALAIIASIVGFAFIIRRLI